MTNFLYVVDVYAPRLSCTFIYDETFPETRHSTADDALYDDSGVTAVRIGKVVSWTGATRSGSGCPARLSPLELYGLRQMRPDQTIPRLQH